MASTRKWFRVGVEGQTADGRKIERRHLAEAAETYSRPKYGARMFVEHIRGINPEWGFKAMGDVHALRTETVKIDGEDLLALYAELEPTEQMVSWARDRQKIFTSMELDTDFAGSGKAYLVGLGVTDSPASLATEVLEFCAANPTSNFLASRKLRPENMFTSALEMDGRFDAEPAGMLAAAREMFAATFGALLSGSQVQPPSPPPAPVDPPPAPSAGIEAFARQLITDVERVANDNATLRNELQQTRSEVQQLRTQMDSTTAPGQSRQPAAGGDGRARTDC
ncbi:MAG: GPO family capsid scaffolding protein [Lysobacteraceae bacterium]